MTDEAEAEVTVRYMLAPDEADVKRRVADLQRRAFYYWAGLDDESRAALAVIVNDVISQLMMSPADWLPSAAQAVSGGRLEINIAIKLEDLEQSVLKLRVGAERRLEEMRQGLIEMRHDLGEESDGTDEEGS